MAQYKKPPAVVSRVLNPLMVAAVTRLGIRPGGMSILQVRGRKTGKPNRVPISPVTIGDAAYLFAPRGNAQWVRNVRAANGKADIWQGRKSVAVTLTEITDAETQLTVMREYVNRYYMMVGKIMEIPKNPSDDVLRSKLDEHPIFRIENT